MRARRIIPMTLRRAALALCTSWVSLSFGVPVPDAAALPSVDEIISELRLSDGDKQRVRDGEIVDWSPSEGSDRELALGMVFLVKKRPESLEKLYADAVILKEVSVITAHGRITGEGTIADLAHLELVPNGEKEAKRYLSVEPGEELNLDASEMAKFRALKSASHDDIIPVKQVEALIREGLMARYHAYRKNGLSGIVPYERDGKQVNAGQELLQSTKELTGVAKHLPAFYSLLLNYPQGMTEGEGKHLKEFFYWLNIDVFGRPTYVLVHRMLYDTGDAAFAMERQFYASHDYNSMLQGIAALPTKEGTFIFYVGRVSTDQVAGFTSAALHPISRAIAAPYIRSTFKELQEKARAR